MLDSRARAWLAPLALLGIGFWFALAFPFANHNESYLWLVQLDRFGLIEVMSRAVPPVVTPRPLGMALAWVSHHASGGSVAPVQAINFVFTAVAWVTLLFAVAEGTLFAALAALVGAVFFSGYIYLFHVHGVFYAFPLLQLALLFHAANRPYAAPQALALAALGVVVSLFHPFALLIHLAFVVGLLYERRGLLDRRTLVASLVGLALAIALVRFTATSGASDDHGAMLHGLLTSYRMLEVNGMVKALSVALTLFTAVSVPVRPGRAGLALLAAVAALAAVGLAGLPLILAWLAACALKLLLRGRLAIAGLLGATAIFPAFTGTGSPTYAVFVVMVAAAVTVEGFGFLEQRLALVPPKAYALFAAAAFGLALLLRSTGPLPGVAKLTGPLLGEKERTVQLEELVAWAAQRDLAGCALALGQSAPPPSASKDAIRRDRRPPTQQQYLDAYLGHRPKAACKLGDAEQLVVYFGDERPEVPARELYRQAGRHAGEVALYATPRAPLPAGAR